MSTPIPPDAPAPDPAHADVAPDAGLDESLLMQGHKYDGIQEYDNPMPGWWTGIFLITILFTPVYILGVHTFDFINDYGDDLAASQADLEQIREAYAAEHGPTIETDAASLAGYAEDPVMVAAGTEVYTTTCASCHGDAGQGLIGPNLTDEFWINGGGAENVYTVINEGVVAKGMPAWGAVLNEEKMAQAMAYVLSLEGTNPPGAKAAEGEPYAGS
jgi:cytochrome c oxidase cbb3-type subunit 3